MLVAVLGGCTTGFLYKRLDWLVVWYVNGLVSLDEVQEDELREIVAAGLEWHRTTQLPRYVAFLAAVDEDTDGAMTVDLVRQRYDEMVVLSDALLAYLGGAATPLLRSLTTQQIEELFENLEDDNEELWDEYAGSTTERRQQRRAKATMRALGRFTGRLTDAQEMLIRQRLAGMHDIAADWLERRRGWQHRFRQLLGSSLPKDEFEAGLRSLLVDPNQFDGTEYRRRAEENLQTVFTMLADLSGELEPAQRERMGKKLRQYATDLDALVRER
jgi:hypothetical protein